MTPQRYKQLTDGSEEEACLTDAELTAGWHFCADWDFMLIHRSQPEYEECVCGWKDLKRWAPQETETGTDLTTGKAE